MDSAKYPRSLHLPYSPGTTSDDRFITEDEYSQFIDNEIVITEKLDGSNVTLTSKTFYARSHNGEPYHPSYNLLRKMHSGYMANAIDKNISVFGEWCFAVHSIKYWMLQDYLNIFGVRDDETGVWWDWDDVCLMANNLGVPTVPVLLRGTFNSKEKLEKVINNFSGLSSIYGPTREGLVIRKLTDITEKKDERGLTMCGLAKWVRKDHVQTDKHWSSHSVVVQPALSNLHYI